MKTLQFPVLILSILLAGPSLASEPFYKENTAYQWITQKYRFSHHLDFRYMNGFNPGTGGSYRLAYSLGEHAVDLQVAYDQTRWGAIFPSLDTGTYSGQGVLDPASQINLPRNASDKWSVLITEAGLSYRGRLVPRTATKWIQSGRISGGRMMLTDQANGLSFTGVTVNVEVSIWYQLMPKLLIGPTFGYRYGWAYLNDQPNVDTNRIPVRMLQATLGTVFRF